MPQLWNCCHQFSARQLLPQFVDQVPGQHQQRVGGLGGQLLGADYRDVAPWQQLALLAGGAVGYGG
jgi:hypothetical protein